ncbi:protein GRAVITROPIC IN THE LIGHT 1 [Elaeis guineensis]|uniref:Protein GRAVITROPIC IN THE LIGHT 1 n=1 Tax=Elaeis guineensis var. tenera TaxID=51953 RepID=A0A6I9R8Q2_ELAGV|nr:protein GRAVITROPIC IN THE LIGHT 1 [Elaeis guineensis]XP_010922714.1 protein GRAVITROPIC IN THE LIGHT 1 [Elaeis guineensis]XP_029120588.1 protein GRAVITROPIC IN THE LIGHT 1 [Elaeis guineensis]
MESALPRTTKNSSNIPGVFLHFPRLRKLKSVGLSGNENLKSTHVDRFIAEEANCCDDNGDRKIHPQPLEETMVASSECLEEAVISRLFATISALKAAYIQLQQAHIPYEPKKIHAADELMVSELESLSELEHLYINKQICDPKLPSSLDLKIQEYQEMLAELQTKIRCRESEITHLRLEMEELDWKNVELEQKIKLQMLPEEELFPLRQELTPALFLEVFNFTSKSIHDFAKPLISLMKASGWNLDKATGSIYGSVIYAERSHKKYAFDAYLSRVMLGDAQDEFFSLEQFDRVMSFRNPFDALMEDPDSSFGRFCRLKYVMAVPSKMECSFFGNLDQRAFILGGGHPRTPFYQAFTRMARWIWALLVLVHSFIPKAEFFYVKRGDDYSNNYMESVVNQVSTEKGEKLKVGFTVMPGIKIGGTIIRCRVYLSRMQTSARSFGFPW